MSSESVRFAWLSEKSPVLESWFRHRGMTLALICAEGLSNTWCYNSEKIRATSCKMINKLQLHGDSAWLLHVIWRRFCWKDFFFETWWCFVIITMLTAVQGSPQSYPKVQGLQSCLAFTLEGSSSKGSGTFAVTLSPSGEMKTNHCIACKSFVLVSVHLEKNYWVRTRNPG